jgi:hypothetical protein
MVVSIRQSLGDIVSGFYTLTKLRYKGDGVADILTIRPQAGGRMDHRRLPMPSDTGLRGRLWMEDNDLHLARRNGGRHGEFQTMVFRHRALELDRDHTWTPSARA